MGISIPEAAGYARAAGFSGESLVTVLAVAMAESGLNPGAQHWNGPTQGCPSGSLDRGILQINSCYWPQYSDACCYDPACAFQAGWVISQGGTRFTPWAAYNAGTYRVYLDRVRSELAEPGPGPGPEPEPPGDGTGVLSDANKRKIVLLAAGLILLLTLRG